MLYLREQANIAMTVDGRFSDEPDLKVDNISPAGDFTMVFNIDLAGPSFIQKLEAPVLGQGEISDPFNTSSRRMLVV